MRELLRLSQRRSVERTRIKAVQLIRRMFAAEGGVGQPNLGAVAQLHYLKVAEVQRRGLARFHCALRLDGPKEVDAEPPIWATSELLERVVRSSIERGWAPDTDGRPVRWGRVFSVRDAKLCRSSMTLTRIDFMTSERVGDPVEGTFQFVGRGYDDPRATQLAELFFTMQRELREEARARERTSIADSNSEAGYEA